LFVLLICFPFFEGLPVEFRELRPQYLEILLLASQEVISFLLLWFEKQGM